MWQKCPICHGTGKVCSTVSALEWVTCKTCNGTTIISELNGLPPDFEKNKKELQQYEFPKRGSHLWNYLQKEKSTDFRDNDMETQQEYFGNK